MDYKRVTASTTAETRDISELADKVGNIYETVKVLGKRANQISVVMKQDLDAKLLEFASYSDNLEEVFENHEQIEISRFYEKLPKPTLLAIDELEHDEIYSRNPDREKEQL